MDFVGSKINFGDIRLRTGVRLHFAQSGSPSGEPVLFLHGYTDSWFSFSPVLPLLPSELCAYALDQRGHGDSERPEGSYAVEDFVEDAVAFLDAVGVRRTTVVGHSMGSYIAQRLAIDHPDRVRRLVLMGSYQTAVNAEVLELAAQVRALTDPVPAEFVHDFQASTAYRALPDAFLSRVVAESRKLPARVWQDVCAGIVAAGSNGYLHRIQSPTLIVWGDRDTFFLREQQERLLEAIPRSTLVIYPETGHALHWERPERFARDLQTFMAPEVQQWQSSSSIMSQSW